MKREFFRFPHTPHLLWVGEGELRDDKVLVPTEVEFLLASTVTVEEKLDGANIGISLDESHQLRAQNRGQYLCEPFVGQFTRFPSWLAMHKSALENILKPNLVLFGEWCAARHSLNYSKLPDWFLAFDIYDRDARKFWSTARRDALLQGAGIGTVPLIFKGKTSTCELVKLVTKARSEYRSGGLEGIVVRRESQDWCEARAKLVRPDFVQSIDEHWRSRVIEWNQVTYN